ncbi:MFS transporter [Streptomyces sp. WMMB 714]|uniref:MFS transporter n=1 Tax=Streptomyces sp. WMMB 714 TaxID=1286822 RepID=UPI0005F7A596|nr:MFS transporter [Streptomyces sp. WMMB 714]
MDAARAGEVPMAGATGRWVLFATVLGSSMVLLDGTVVNVALPRIGEDLDASLAGLQWAVNAYLLTLAGLILLGGSLGDRYGRRRVFVVGVLWFAVSSALCGFAVNAEMLIGARALQGVGGALLSPGSLAIIQAVFRPADRAPAVGTWAGLGGVAGAVGPLLGGWLVGGPGWRWVFLINVPPAVLTVLIAARHVPETRDETASGRFDVPGAVLAALSLGSLTYALTAASTRPATSVATGAAAVVLGAAFIRTERRSPRPMMPLSLFSSRLFSTTNTVTVLIYGALAAVQFFLVLQLQTTAGFSPLLAGLALLPLTLLMLAFSSRAARLGSRIGPHIPLTAGPVIAAAGVLLMLRIGPDASYFADVLPAGIALGAGMTLLVAPLTATVLDSVPVARAGTASGVNNAAARTGGLVSVAAIPAIVGLSGDEYRSPADVDAAFQGAMISCAGLLLVAAVVALMAVRAAAPAPDSVDAVCATCSVTAPPPTAERRPHGTG